MLYAEQPKNRGKKESSSSFGQSHCLAPLSSRFFATSRYPRSGLAGLILFLFVSFCFTGAQASWSVLVPFVGLRSPGRWALRPGAYVSLGNHSPTRADNGETEGVGGTETADRKSEKERKRAKKSENRREHGAKRGESPAQNNDKKLHTVVSLHGNGNSIQPLPSPDWPAG